MKNSNVVVVPNAELSLHFTLRLDNGDIVDSTEGKPAARMRMGDGKLLPTFEQFLLGMTEGESGSFNVLPAQAFGQHNSSNVQSFKRSQFAGMVLECGAVVSFADAAGSELPGVVAALNGDDVTVDFNHPLAGKSLVFEATIVTIHSDDNK